MMNGSTPRLPPLLFATFAVVALLLVAGAVLFFVPFLVGSRWPWVLKPFHARFLGAVYLAELLAVLLALGLGRRSPARVTVPQAALFSVVVALASVIQYRQFSFHRLVVWGWFVVSCVPMLVLAVYALRRRKLAPVGAAVVPAAWRGVLLAQAAVLSVYGLGPFVAPSIFGAFWPWYVDDFHGQVYSAVFLAAALGAWMLYRSAERWELATQGLTLAAFGALSILDLWLMDRLLQVVDWSSLGTWAWVAACALLAAVGLGDVAVGIGASGPRA